MPDHVQLVAHRGGSALAPENTLAAFRNALRYPIDAVELDVQMSRDGQVIVFHDNTLERLTNGSGNILDHDFADLRSLNAAAHFPGGWPAPQQMPTLREVFELVKGRAQVYIEIKTSKRDGVTGRYPHLVESVIADVRAAYMLGQVYIISFDWTVLPEIKAMEPVLPVGALVSKDAWDPQKAPFGVLAELVKSLGFEWLNMDFKLYAPDMPAIVHANGLKIGLWTVNTLDDLRNCAADGVDSLTSDHPDLFVLL
ncbi:MAG TPA: glycerophosphodiester phosphodiesterase family protein [Ktedonobacteraceae bacterium]|nr:glycerophosphodiester phosphodiesterase family protein [Ktedonobacteraceae bacterium]